MPYQQPDGHGKQTDGHGKQSYGKGTGNDNGGDWAALTDCVDAQLLARILGTAGRVTLPTVLGDVATWRLSTTSCASTDLDDMAGAHRSVRVGLEGISGGLGAVRSWSQAREEERKGNGKGEQETARRQEEHESILRGMSREHLLNLTPIDLKRTWGPDATGRERTMAALDCTWALNNVLATHFAEHHNGGTASTTTTTTPTTTSNNNTNSNDDTIHGLQLIGELQFCFIAMLTLANYSSLEQWRRILTLLLRCRTAITTRAPLFIRTLRLLQRQLNHVDALVESGTLDFTTETNWLRTLLRKFKLGIADLEGSMAKQDVLDELDELEGVVYDRFGWHLDDSNLVKRGLVMLEDGEEVEVVVGGYDEEDESGEYAPVVVDLGQGHGSGAAVQLDYDHGVGGNAKSTHTSDDDGEDEEVGIDDMDPRM